MIQDQNHLWQQPQPLPLITQPPVNPNPLPSDATASPSAQEPVLPAIPQDPDDYLWLSLL